MKQTYVWRRRIHSNEAGKAMLHQVVRASEAFLEATQHSRVVLVPALSGCTTCNTVRVIAAPHASQLRGLWAELVVLSSEEPRHGTLGTRVEVHPQARAA